MSQQATVRQSGGASRETGETETFSDGARLWNEARSRRVVFLLDASSILERRVLREWISCHRPAEVEPQACEMVPLPGSRRRRRRRLSPLLEECLAAEDDPLLAPLRVVWCPEIRDGHPALRLSHFLTGSDPRDPGLLRQVWTLRTHPERCRVVAGEPAPLSELRRRWREAGGVDVAETSGLPAFVARQAVLALERAERRLRGARYKVPRLVREEILGRPAFRAAVAQLARRLGRSPRAVSREATRYLREIAATHSPLVIDLTAALIRLLYTRGYGALRYDAAELEAIYDLGQRCPLVFLPTHKSNFDHLVLQYVLYETGHPPNHTAGGINMNFFPVGPLVRRSGVFFIRRTFRDNEVYKLVLRSYIDYLIEKRFSLEWYIEGGRSRSGKLLPPRFGLLAYVVDAYRRGKAEDVYLVPVSIAYDQIQDVGDYVAEQRGAPKERESFGWFVRFLRRLRRDSGEIHVRFGEPLSLRSRLGAPSPERPPDPDERSLQVQKLAFEIAVRINRVTPITPTSLVTLALLGSGDRALSTPELLLALENLVHYVRRRRLPTTTPLDPAEPRPLLRALELLVRSGVVSAFTEGPEPVYMIGPGQELAAAYYRNTVIHFFVNAAITELALLAASEARQGPVAGIFEEEALALRDFFKFEFFFPPREEFLFELREELSLHDPGWQQALTTGGEAILELVRRFRPFSAHRILRPFADAYRVVADQLVRYAAEPAPPAAEVLDACIALGRQYRLQRRIRSSESISRTLFATALRLADNRRLLTGGDDLDKRRRGLAAECAGIIRRIEAIEALAASRRAGLID